MASELLHLAKRFVGSLSTRRPSEEDKTWMASFLSVEELALWEEMTAADQRHAVLISRRVAQALEGSPALSDPALNDPALAAAALHDVGKVRSELGTFARVGATLFWKVVPDDRAFDWLDRTDVIGRLAAYRLHPQIGADMLVQAGSDRLTVQWAAQHHLPEASWTVPVELGRVLKACDDD